MIKIPNQLSLHDFQCWELIIFKEANAIILRNEWETDILGNHGPCLIPWLPLCHPQVGSMLG